jgi:hypothetical protein
MGNEISEVKTNITSYLYNFLFLLLKKETQHYLIIEIILFCELNPRPEVNALQWFYLLKLKFIKNKCKKDLIFQYECL